MISRDRELVPTYDEAGLAQLNPEAASVAREMLDINRHPVIKSVYNIEGQGAHHLGHATQYLSSVTMIGAIQDGILDRGHDIDTVKSSRSFEAITGQPVSMLAADSLSVMMEQHADQLGITCRQLASRIIDSKDADLTRLIIDNIRQVYHRGLIPEDGDVNNLFEVADHLRFLNTVMLFRPSTELSSNRGHVFDSIYEQVVGEAMGSGVLNQQASRYADAYATKIIRAARVRRIRRQSAQDIAEVTNRAALMVMLDEARMWFETFEDVQGTRPRHEVVLRAIGRASDLPELHQRVLRVSERIAALKAEGSQSIMGSESLNQALEVEWEFYPPGELGPRVQKIIETATASGREVTIDKQRLQILTRVREAVGPDRCYFASCRLGKRRMVRKDGAEEPDQFLTLVMQRRDDWGNLLGEDTLSVSPIAGPHAMYVTRQDASEGLPWTEILALTKRDARYFNARAVRYVMPTGGGDLISLMTDKACALLRASKEDFLRIQFVGGGRVRLPGGVLPPVEGVE